MYPEYPFTSHYLSLAKGRLHYVDEGDGPVILMVHGNPTWSYYYRNLIKQFRKTHRVIAMDHMGCGLSDKPKDYDYCLTQHIQNAEQLISALNIRKFSLVVHDWGGAIGMGLTLSRLPDIDKIVVCNTAAFRSQQIPFRISICRLPVIGEFIVRFLNGFAWPALSMAVVNKIPKEIAKTYISPYDSWDNRVAIFNFVKDIPLQANHKSYNKLVEIENNLKNVKEAGIPLKIIWGGRDFCFNDTFFNEWRTRFPSASHHYFADGGHYILEDKKIEISRLLEDFL